MIQEIDNNSHSLCIRRRQGQLPRRCGGLSIGGSKIVCELMYKYTLVMLNVALRIIPLTSFPLHNNFKIEVSIPTTSFHRTHLKSFNIKIMPSTFFKSTPPCAFYILLGHKSVLTKFESIACFILIIKNGKLYVSSRNFRGSRGIHGGMNKIDSPRHVPLLDVGMFQFSHYCFYD
uniref:Uncharacterized protein n=1 Tax=Cacopsylla melanoneura TaxID=428564 RepID=A0A8D8VAW6_9HEMI